MAGELDALLQQWTEHAGLDTPVASDAGRFMFTFDGEYEVSLFQSGDTIYLEADLGPLPDRREQAAEVVERCMKLQLARLGSMREVLSIDPESGHLALFRTLAARTITRIDFEQAVEKFVNASEFWTEQARRTPSRTAPPVALTAIMP